MPDEPLPHMHRCSIADLEAAAPAGPFHRPGRPYSPAEPLAAYTAILLSADTLAVEFQPLQPGGWRPQPRHPATGTRCAAGRGLGDCWQSEKPPPARRRHWCQLVCISLVRFREIPRNLARSRETPRDLVRCCSPGACPCVRRGHRRHHERSGAVRIALHGRRSGPYKHTSRSARRRMQHHQT